VKILLIRHGSREHSGEDADAALAASGRKQMHQVADLLKRLELLPSIYLSSHFRHAGESASLLAKEVSTTSKGPVPAILSLCSLTPHSPTSLLEEIIDESQAMHFKWQATDVIVVVGHEPRLSQLLTR
jgi:phosphohistidine phosphatase SixA